MSVDRLELKSTLSIDDAGTITGTAWPFNAGPDSVGDLIQKGAFNVAVSTLPMLYAHNPDYLVGDWSEAKETDDGFTVKGQLHLKDSARARAVRGMVQGGLISGLSIGFRTREAKQQGRNRLITALDLVEVSLVRHPSHPRARVTSAKSLDAASLLATADILKRFAAALR
jgi:uncharacterized protein